MMIDVALVPPPFIIKHLSFPLRPYSYVLLPCKFLPSKKGVVQHELLLKSRDNKYKTTVLLIGEGE